MRLHRLELAAFGPYADTVTVDFDALGADGLFLLYGDTGAGKTTVLDGIAYALFGQVPGARQKAGRLRCDHAEPSLAARVRLELTLGGRRLRVTRSPEWQRPKLRGPGTTTAPAKALLEVRRDGEWEGLSTRIDEVSHQLQDWLGMSAEQFFQVVLLPQGEFARFLRAESSEREELLERLFGTRRFSEAEAWLAARRRSTQGEVQGIEEQLSVLLARFCQAAGVPESATPALADADAGWVTEIAAAAELSAGLTASQSADAAVVLAAAQKEYDQVVGLLRRQERLRAAEAARAAVEAGRPEQATRQRVLDRARRAARVEPLVRSWRQAGERASSAAAAVGSARLSVLGGDVELPDRELAAAAAELRREIAVLGELRAAEESLPGLAAEVGAAESELAAVLAGIAAESTRRVALPEEIAGARSAVAGAERAGEHADRWDEQVARLCASLAAARELEIALDAEAAARGLAQAAVDEHQEAREAVLDLRQRRLAGIAAELAEGLDDGDPCPVCGASDHPVPAEPADRVTEADESAAAFAEDRARSAREAAADALAGCELDVARLSALAGGESAGDLAGQVADAEAELAAARSAAAGLDAAVRLLAALEAESQRLAENELVLSGRAAGLRERQERSAAALAELRDRVSSAAGGDPGLGARIARLTATAEVADALREARRVAAERTAAEARALGDAEREATAAGFAGMADAEAAALPERELAALDDAVREFERADAATAAALGDPDLAGVLAGGELADPGPASGALDAARARALDAASAARRAEHVHAEVTRLAASFDAAVTEAGPVRDRAAKVAALADLVAGQGQNVRRMTLRAYVLAARLDEVARSASVRLRRMSGGRYSFVFTGDADSRRVRAGLGLRILDDYSGLARSTRTLSGGESFMASLSLALGLADVVAAESGGISIETLFIDEGFGSLDADTLDLVMDTLDELRAGGRVIGLVSHVAEMRQRIPMRLRVRKIGIASRLELEAG